LRKTLRTTSSHCSTERSNSKSRWSRIWLWPPWVKGRVIHNSKLIVIQQVGLFSPVKVTLEVDSISIKWVRLTAQVMEESPCKVINSVKTQLLPKA